MEGSESFCWEISGCLESRRSACPAYRNRRNCWEVMGTPINSDHQAECEHCAVILSRIARAIAGAIGQSQGSPTKR